MTHAPVTHLGHHRDQLIAGGRERVSHLWRVAELGFALDYAVGFELAKLSRQDLFAHTGEQVAQLGKAARAEAEMPHHQNLPLTAEHVDGALYRASEVVLVIAAVAVVRHGDYLCGQLGLQNCAYFQGTRHSYSIFTGRQNEQLAPICSPALPREKQMILVTGASGTVGKEVLKQVAKSGAKHRAMFRSPEDAKSAPAGTETVIADFAKKETLPAALRGVESVYLVCSPIPDLVQLESNAIDACAQAGVKHVVLNSALGAGDYDKSFPSWHRKVEDRLRSTRLSWTILRPNSFHQNTVAYYAPSIRAEGVFYASLGASRMSYVDVRDVAAAAVVALKGAEHTGKIYEVNGPEALTSGEIAAKIAKHSARSVKYVDIPIDAQRQAMLDMGMPGWQVSALVELQQYYVSGKGGEVDSTLENLLGRSPIPMDEFLKENAPAFRPQQASA